MREYIFRRILLVPVTLLGVTAIVFILAQMIPGDVVDLMYEELAYAQDMEEMRARPELDSLSLLSILNG